MSSEEAFTNREINFHRLSKAVSLFSESFQFFASNGIGNGLMLVLDGDLLHGLFVFFEET